MPDVPVQILTYLAVAAAAFLVGLLAEQLVRSRLRKRFAWPSEGWSGWAVANGFRLVPAVLTAVLAIRILMLVEPPGAAVEPVLIAALEVALVVAAVRMGLDAGLAALRARETRLGQQGMSILRNTLVTIALLVGTMLILDQVGISVGPILATLGVGALALALALQPTLGNIFAGMQLVGAAQFREGDFVKVHGADVEGYVTDIGWRTTTLRTLLDNHVIIPNSQLADSVLTNLDTPDPKVRLRVPVGVHYDTDMEHAEQTAREVIRRVQDESDAGVGGFGGDIRWTGFGDSAVTFNAVLQAKAPEFRFDLANAFIKLLHRRFGDEGIEIPYPIRNLYLRTGVQVSGPAGQAGPG